MIKSFKFFSLTLLLLFGAGKAFSQKSIELEGVTYEITKDFAKVTDFSKIYDSFVIAESLVIEENGKSATYPVTTIDSKFDNTPGWQIIESLTIPASITTITEQSFQGIKTNNLYIEDLISWAHIDFQYDHDQGTSSPWYQSCANPMGQETVVYVNGIPVTDSLIIEGCGIVSPFAFMGLNCKQVIIGKGTTHIGIHAFLNSTLEELAMGPDLETIEQQAFEGCANLTRVTLSPVLSTIGYKAFPETFKNEYKDVAIREVFVPSIETFAYLDYEWGNNFYWGAYKPIFGSSYTLYVNNETFENISIPGFFKDLGAFCMGGVKNVYSVTCEEGIKGTGFSSFMDCENLESVTFPSTLETFYTSFEGCPNLTTIKLKSLTPPKPGEYYFNYFSISNPIFYTATIFVPEESIELYRNDEFWSNFVNILPIDETTSVDSLPTDSEDISGKVIYDLQGRKVSGENLAPGIYVIDGKKIKM